MIETAGHTLAVQNAAVHKVSSVRAVGTRAVLAELSGTQDVLALQALLLEHPLPGQLDVLAAAETVLVTADSPASARRIAARLLQLDLTAPAQRDGELVVIDTVYDGEDLAEVGELTGLGTDGVIAAHTGQIWTVAFAGFAPGFGYMVGENQALEVPRRSSPRTAVPAGSVALAGNYSAVYPRRSPGGWQLIGRTGAAMWDLDREQPALAAPGHRVQFRAVRDVVDAGAGTARLRSAAAAARRWPIRPADRFARAAEPDPGPRPPRPLRPGRLRRRRAGPGLAAPGQPPGRERAVGRRGGDRRRRAHGAGRRGPGPRRRRGAVGTDHRVADDSATTSTSATPGRPGGPSRWPPRSPCSTAKP